jgi:DNA-binding transcriptional LysR family regulator
VRRPYADQRTAAVALMNVRHHVELRHLEHFLAVAEEGSFTRAAARVHLVQSALSVSVRALERELGARLFDRTTHRVELTDAGIALVEQARSTLAAADAARDAVAAVKGGVRGTVRLGIMHSLALIDLAALLTAYSRAHPDVRLVPVAAEGGSEQLAREVLEGRLDLAFASLPSGHPAGLTARTLATEEMLLGCPPENPFGKRRIVELAELDGMRFVDFPPGWGIRRGVDDLFAERRISREIAVEVADVPTVSALVRAGFGYAFIGPSNLGEGPRPTLVRVRPAPKFAVDLVTPTQRPLSAATRAMVDLVSSSFPR